MNYLRSLRGAAALIALTAALAVSACEPSSIFDVDEFGEIQLDLDLSGIPAEDSDGFAVRWQHADYEEITRTETFFVIEPPEFAPRPLEQIPVGRVQITLTRLPRNCEVADPVPEKTVTVRRNQSTPVTFTVGCS